MLKVKTSTKNDAHISRPFWIFELNLIVFDFGNLNSINNLNVQIMLELLLDHGNNSASVHEYFQDFRKCLGIFPKLKTEANN